MEGDRVGMGSVTCPWRWNWQNVQIRRHIKFRRQGITQKKAYNIQNQAKVWNKKYSVVTGFFLRPKFVVPPLLQVT